MRIPKKVLVIGTVSGITYKPTKSRTSTSIDFDARGDEYVIATNSTHTQLYIFPNVRTGKVDAVTDDTGLVKGFIHQAVHYDVPAVTLKKIGSIVTIRYKSRWWETVQREYRHDFKKGVAFYADKYSRFSVMGIKPARGKVINKNGIVS